MKTGKSKKTDSQSSFASIPSNPKILEREREKSVLLEITEALSRSVSREYVLKVIYQHLRKLLPFYGSELFVISEAENYYQMIITGETLGDRPLPQGTTERLPHTGSAIEWLARDFGIVQYNDLKQQFSNHPRRTALDEAGIRQMIHGPLVSNGRIIGMLCLNAQEEDAYDHRHLRLFRYISDQIAVAVCNILANEEIVEREREKSVLLSISEAITCVREKDDLLCVITEKIKPLFTFDDAVIALINQKEQTQKAFLLNVQKKRKNHRDYQKAVGLRYPLNDGLMNVVLASDEPCVFDVAQQAQKPGAPEYLKFLQATGIKEMAGAKLRTAGETVGVFYLQAARENAFDRQQFKLLQSISDQVAIAVSNILANERIVRQLAEIESLKARLEAENTYLVEEVRKNYNFEEIIGNSPSMRTVFERVELVAPTDATVLIQGETGTGKELIARAVHSRSPRATRPLIKVNCAALPRELVESELFGHERGSFTGAHERRIGKFELAHQGTIFLDEIGELPLETQVKLLAVLQEKEIERVGGRGTIKLDLRVVAATNRKLAQEVQAGRFRADLYYRLSTVEVFVPSLRARREDIADLTMYFAAKYAAKFSRRIRQISNRMLTELDAYDFPGNVRELEHIVEQAVIFSRDETLDLPRPLVVESEKSFGDEAATFNPEPNAADGNGAAKSLQNVEREHILSVLRQTGGRVKGERGAAKILGLNPATLFFRIKKLGIERRSERR